MFTLNLHTQGPVVKWLLKKKVTKSIASANMLLLTIFAINMTITVYADTPLLHRQTAPQTYREDIPLSAQKNLPPKVLAQIPSRYAN